MSAENRALWQFLKKSSPRLLWKKPRLLLKVMRQFLRARVLGKTSVFGVDFAITFACNLNCQHCLSKAFHELHDPRRDCLSTKEIVSIIEECRRNGIFVFVLQGGEPLAHPGLEEIIEACAPKENYVILLTNGMAVTEEKLARYRELGVDRLDFSIDSWIPEEHDAFRRREGAFRRVRQAMESARGFGLKVSIAVTVTNETLHTEGIQGLFQYCITERIPVQIFVPQRCGNWRHKEDFQLTEENHRYLDDLNERYGFIKRDIHGTFGEQGCPALRHSMYITAKGDVIPCPFIHISFGNLRRERLEDILKRAETAPYFADRYPRCLAAEHDQFIEEVLSKTFDAEELPISVEAAFFGESRRVAAVGISPDSCCEVRA